jgi:hypothetical protein
MRLLSCFKKASIYILDASHLISKTFVKLGKAKIGVKHNLIFNNLKASSCSLSHLKPTTLFIIQLMA